jgi:hypothetical protein
MLLADRDCGWRSLIANDERESGVGLGLFGALLLDLLDFVEQVVGLLGEAGALIGGINHIGLAAIEQAQVGHSIVVVRPYLKSLLNSRDALLNHG